MRKDDAPETVLKRLEVYREQTEPIVAYYRKLGKEAVINSDQPLEKVQAELMTLLGVKNGSHD